MHLGLPNESENALSEQRRFLRICEHIALGLFLLIVLAFGLLVEYRSAFLKRRMTDLDVYLRAAWAVRTGADLYAITDDNGWHYHYPPLLAILLAPLADAPAGYDRTGMMPFAVSVLLWYFLSVGCLMLALAKLVGALANNWQPPERTSISGRLRWWLLFFAPLVVCLPPVGHTLMRGQVNLLLLCLLSFMSAAYLRGQRGQAGLWLAAAICLKVIPAFLLIYPLWRRDFRSLATCGIGLGLGLGLIPALVFGPQRTLDYYREWDIALRQPALADGADRSRAKELIEITATDSQSYVAVFHNLLNWDRSSRPAQASFGVRTIHWVIGGLLTALTLVASGFRAKRGKENELMALGCLILMMILLSPVCHLHYFCLCIPLVMAMTARIVQEGGGPAKLCGWVFVASVYLALQILPQLPRLEKLRDAGLAAFASLFVWALAITLLFLSREGNQSSGRLESTAAAA